MKTRSWSKNELNKIKHQLKNINYDANKLKNLKINLENKTLFLLTEAFKNELLSRDAGYIGFMDIHNKYGVSHQELKKKLKHKNILCKDGFIVELKYQKKIIPFLINEKKSYKLNYYEDCNVVLTYLFDEDFISKLLGKNKKLDFWEQMSVINSIEKATTNLKEIKYKMFSIIELNRLKIYSESEISNLKILLSPFEYGDNLSKIAMWSTALCKRGDYKQHLKYYEYWKIDKKEIEIELIKINSNHKILGRKLIKAFRENSFYLKNYIEKGRGKL